MTPETLRAYTVILTADVAPVAAGFLILLAPPGGRFTEWMVPIVLGAFGIPVVRPRMDKPTPAPEP